MSNININIPSAEKALEDILSYSSLYMIQRHFEILYRFDKDLLTEKFKNGVYNKYKMFAKTLFEKTIPALEKEIQIFFKMLTFEPQTELIDKLRKDVERVKAEVNRERIKAVIDKFNDEHNYFKHWYLLTDDEISEEHWTESSQGSLLDLKYLDEYMKFMKQLVDTYIKVCNRFISIYDRAILKKEKGKINFDELFLQWNYNSDTLFKIFTDLITDPYLKTELPVLQANDEQIKQLIHLRFVDKDGNRFQAVLGKDKKIDNIFVNKAMTRKVFVDIFFQLYQQFILKADEKYIIPNSTGEIRNFIIKNFVHASSDSKGTPFKEGTINPYLTFSRWEQRPEIGDSDKFDMSRYFSTDIIIIDPKEPKFASPRKKQYRSNIPRDL